MTGHAPTWVAHPHPHLHRAIVALPPQLASVHRTLQERVVFFMAPHGVHAASRLAELLSLAWNIDTRDWCERGYIYNVDSARALVAQNATVAPCSALATALLLLETGFGGADAIGPGGQHYARAADVDLFVIPRVAEQMHAALHYVERLYALAASRVSAGAAA